MQLMDIVCILQNKIKNPRQGIDRSTIQPHFLYTRLWVITFTFLCPMIRVEHSFYLQRVCFHFLFFPLPIMVQVALTCFDLQKVRRTRNTWVYTDLDFVASFAVGTYNVMLAWEWVRHFSTESKLHHQSWSLCCCYLFLFYILQRSRQQPATTWARFQSTMLWIWCVFS